MKDEILNVVRVMSSAKTTPDVESKAEARMANGADRLRNSKSNTRKTRTTASSSTSTAEQAMANYRRTFEAATKPICDNGQSDEILVCGRRTGPADFAGPIFDPPAARVERAMMRSNDTSLDPSAPAAISAPARPRRRCRVVVAHVTIGRLGGVYMCPRPRLGALGRSFLVLPITLARDFVG